MLMDNVYRELLNDYKDGEKKFSPSNAGYCAEKLRRQIKQKEVLDIPPNVLWKFLLGNAVHEEVQSLLFKFRGSGDYTYKKAEKELKIQYKDMTLNGRADFWFAFDGEEWVADFKVVSDKTFWYAKKEDNEVYLTQLSLYAYALGIENILLVYLNAENGDFLEKKYKRRDDLIEKAYQKWVAIETGKGIEEFSPSSDWECGYCSFASSCPFAKNKKVSKQVVADGSGEISQEVIDEYVATKKQIEELEKKLDELKTKILSSVDFSNTDVVDAGNLIIQKIVSETVSYDKKVLEKIVSPELLEKAKKVSVREQYRINVKEEK